MRKYVYDAPPSDAEDQNDVIVATVTTAGADVAQQVLNAPVGDLDGRSEFVWLRLPNGDLLLGVFPFGDTYETAAADEAANA